MQDLYKTIYLTAVVLLLLISYWTEIELCWVHYLGLDENINQEDILHYISTLTLYKVLLRIAMR